MPEDIMKLEYDRATGNGTLKLPTYICEMGEKEREKTLVSLLLIATKEICRICSSPIEYIVAELIIANSYGQVMEQIRRGEGELCDG